MTCGSILAARALGTLLASFHLWVSGAGPGAQWEMPVTQQLLLDPLSQGHSPAESSEDKGWV